MINRNPIDIDELEHRATNAYGTTLKAVIEQSKDDEDMYFLIEKGTNKKLGYMDFSVISSKKVVFINDMENSAHSMSTTNKGKSYVGIGSLLHEFVFYYLAKKKIDYPIQLTKAYGSHIFHYKCGYRFRDEKANQLMEEAIQKGPEFYNKKENMKDFPDTMVMSLDEVRNRKDKYSPAPHARNLSRNA